MWLIIKGFLAAILSVVVLCGALIGVPAALGGVESFLGGLVIGVGAALFIAPIAIALFGIPIVYLLRRLGRNTLRAYFWASFGTCTCLAFWMAFNLPANSARGFQGIFEILVVLIAGPCAATVFWSVTRPDQAIKQKTAPLA